MFLPVHAKNKYAVVTLSTPSVCERTAVLCRSVLKHKISEIDVVVMHLDKFSQFTKEPKCAPLLRLDVRWKLVPKIPKPGTLSITSWNIAFSKVNALKMVQYERVLLTDSDAFFRVNKSTFVTDYFALNPGVIYVSADQWNLPCGGKRRYSMNAGLVSFAPSENMYKTFIRRSRRDGCLSKEKWTWSEQELLICLTIKEHIFPYVIWPVAMSMTPDTWTKCPHEAGCGVRHVHFADGGKPPQPANQHRFHREWRDLYAELF
jgi:alpha-N-acetylglucosamine transferase